MAKTKQELLDEYEQKALGWYIENNVAVEWMETRSLDRFERFKYHADRPRTPWPLTEEETADWYAIYKELDELAKELVDDEPQHLLFFTCGMGHKIKFVK